MLRSTKSFKFFFTSRSMTRANSIVSTGITKLDDVLIEGKQQGKTQRGIPLGTTLLVEGTPGAGQELLAKQFAAIGVGTENVVYFATDETSEELVETFENYRWPTDCRIVNIGTQHFEKVLARDIQAARHRQEGITVQQLKGTGAYSQSVDQIDFLSDTVYEACKVKEPARLIIDSLDFFLETYTPSQVYAAMRSIKNYVKLTGGVALFTVSEGSHDSQVHNRINAIADVVVGLEMKKLASEFENRLFIKKVRNHPEKSKMMVYAITSHGITPEEVTRIS